jgi:hypothetical protein
MSGTAVAETTSSNNNNMGAEERKTDPERNQAAEKMDVKMEGDGQSRPHPPSDDQSTQPQEQPQKHHHRRLRRNNSSGSGSNSNYKNRSRNSPEEEDDIENVRDSLKALEEVRQDAEKGMFMFDGAIHLLFRQYQESVQTQKCAVCHRRLETKHQLEECVNLLKTKRETVLQVRNEEAVSLYESCVQAMQDLLPPSASSQSVKASTSADLTPNGLQFPTPASTRLAFYLRTGELSEWRQQKLDCMTTMSCFACSKRFTAEEFSSFLKRVDHRASVMERELHVHPKFCPAVVTPPPTVLSTPAEDSGNESLSPPNQPMLLSLLPTSDEDISPRPQDENDDEEDEEDEKCRQKLQSSSFRDKPLTEETHPKRTKWMLSSEQTDETNKSVSIIGAAEIIGATVVVAAATNSVASTAAPLPRKELLI